MNLASLEEARVILRSVATSEIYSVCESGTPGNFNLENTHGYALVEDHSGSQELTLSGDFIEINGRLFEPVSIEPVPFKDIPVLPIKQYAFTVVTQILVDAVSAEEAWEHVQEQARISIADFEYNLEKEAPNVSE